MFFIVINKNDIPLKVELLYRKRYIYRLKYLNMTKLINCMSKPFFIDINTLINQGRLKLRRAYFK